MSENDESLPRLLGGRYRLEAKLGSGGMGVVYRASDLTMHRSVAVKLIRGVDGVALDEEVAGRFLREAKNTARIQHENIIEVFDLGRSEGGDMFFVMELLEGESLSAKLRREIKIAPAPGVHIARQMCAALHVAHVAGIIHRDLKPANVMLVQRGTDASYVKVLDFGVAKSYTPDQETQLTHTGMLVGTVEYMAPEQIMGRKVDGRTDIYALGVVMYRMFSGKAPFRDGGVPALIHAHLNVFPKPISETTSTIPGALDRVVLRCLAKQPEQRYESMEELSRALAAALEPTGIVSLEYGSDDDLYDAGDKTEIARPGRPQEQEPAPPARGPVNDSYDDATMKMDRPDRSAIPQPTRGVPPRPVSTPPSGRSPARGGVPRIGGEADDPPHPLADVPIDRTAVMHREDVSTARRQLPEEITRIDNTSPRECAMCRTMNPPHSRACNACGVSLAIEDQDAVRARVTAPRTTHLSAPHLPPPVSGAYPAPRAPFGHSPAQGVQASQPMQRPPIPQPSMSSQSGSWGPTTQAPPTSAWQRFLAWTGLRGR